MGVEADEPRIGAPELALRVAWFGALLLAGLLVHAGAVLVPGHNGDTGIMAGWASRIADVGPGHVYDGILSVYPALLYILWPLGAIFRDQPLDLLIKGLSIPFDLALAVLIALIAQRIASPRAAFGAAALYLFNPAALLAGPVWGQVDTIGTLAFVGALAASAARRHGLAGVLGAVAGMLKPQFGLVLLPVLLVAGLCGRRDARWGPPLRAVVGALATYIFLAAPLMLDPLRYWQQLRDVVNAWPFASLYAMNPWGLLLGFDTFEQGYAPWGLALLLVGLVAAVVPLWRRSDLAALLASGTLIVFAVYFLPTRSHERYLFPALATLAPLAVTSGKALAAYLVFSAAFAISLVYALLLITPFSLPPPVAGALTSSAAVWCIGIVLMLSAIGWLAILRASWLAPRPTGRSPAT